RRPTTTGTDHTRRREVRGESPAWSHGPGSSGHDLKNAGRCPRRTPARGGRRDTDRPGAPQGWIARSHRGPRENLSRAVLASSRAAPAIVHWTDPAGTAIRTE